MSPFAYAERATPERVPAGDDRSSFQRDRDIIVYTSAFQRLAGITQVVSGHTGHVFHNRLTHTLQVAQVGRRLAEKLHIRQPLLSQKLILDPDVVEAACLAHDLGHPPFGHVAEQVLNRLAGEDVEGFEGNAQSFRIVCELAFRSPAFNGLNLTRATLRAVLKYPWTYAKRPQEKQDKWGAYESESGQFKFVTGDGDGGPVSRSPEAELMDWSDDLTYAVHDVEDFFRAGVIPLHLLRPPGKAGVPNTERNRFIEYVGARQGKIPELKGIAQQELDNIFGDVIFSHFTIEGAYEGTREQRARLRSFTSRLVDRYINGLKLRDGKDREVAVEIDAAHQREIAILKQLTWYYVIEAASLAMQQHAQKQVIRCLFGVFRNETRKTPSNLLPAYFRERLADVVKTQGVGGPGARRIVVDLIAGMTEAQAIEVYQRLNGITVGSALDKLLV